MSQTDWHGKPYYSLDAWCKNTYQHKCYKVALNAHMSCPNRDGTLGTRGCIFCSAGGSGDFAGDLEAGIRKIADKLPDMTSPCIIAYFQAYTNTYAPCSYLEKIYTEALSFPLVCGISIATRPDCLPDEVLGLLSSLKKRFPDKFIWIELGLQTIHQPTADFIRRGYDLPCFEAAMTRLNAIGIPVIVHVILGLPGETEAQMLETVQYLNAFHPFGIKLQLLHVLENTDLADCYRNGDFKVLTKDVYLGIVTNSLEALSPDIVVHRVTGDGPKKILIAPQWSADKRDVLNSLHALMKKKNARQGDRIVRKL